jgi:Carbamoyl-phosphate synthetase large chain, oligomerisation domain
MLERLSHDCLFPGSCRCHIRSPIQLWCHSGCLRSLKIGRCGLGSDGKPWRIGTELNGDRDILSSNAISRKLSVPNAGRIFFLRHALRTGFNIEEIFNLKKIDRWFLTQIKEVVDYETEPAETAGQLLQGR